AVLDALRAKGVRVVTLTLHVGVGTFRPVDEHDLRAHRMHEEWYEVPGPAAEAFNGVREAGGAAWAVGTTVARTLESAVRDDGTVRS
ncbi:MAG: S-adenosylmethionine:tRNA ribosyltransferase-isomerase, partial [Gemmatimonadetes bacterium]|nr:S-adenosylmethionine:tRNA ribosyltransferase-isomerase [Gemmatimonadota bacterium]NIQ54648.1 S-adenosylmethionine:tRNA ribosyltransferase-isomerase [Gemmatimonadota bacterium]NIU74857.1 S-adenosylmethionine:tRNA ribosyltransferase-isomerase [Gammaproteobacteria bacterium]NIX44749.1 S-adenosylmethionine:tRNA ribosyltransferase-isomerase [Gemmatimonadota bacterium]NIY08994.1 S-adenosylmethionine:tRNA ribosyltransferase-isomerase [Gemmatimonadota bacterium]